MNRLSRLLAACCIAAALVIAPALAETRTITLAVSGMTWGGCVISVQRSLTKIKGVSKADVSLEKAEASVTFDDAKTSVDALLKATRDAGYPSAPKGAPK